MKGIAFSAYYEPEIASSMYLTINLYEDIVKAGIEMDLFVPLPTRGVSDEVRNKYKKIKKEYKFDNKLKKHRIFLPKESKNILLRTFRYILMNILFILKGISVSADFIFVQSTPPTQGAMAAILKKIKNIPVIYNLQDVFPDSLVGTGITNEGTFIYKVGQALEKYTYNNVDKIIVISKDMKENLLNKGVDENKIIIIRNWIDQKVVKPIQKNDNYFFDKFKISRDRFNVVYAGNLGYAQNIEIILDAAKKLQEYRNIQFLIFGRGHKENDLKQLANNMNLKNLSFYPFQPFDEVSYIYGLADVSLVTCNKGLGGSAMPSKMWSILATGTPVIASFDSNTELEKIIKKYELGQFGEANNVKQLVDNILFMYNNQEKMDEYKYNSLHYINLYANRTKATQNYIQLIKSTNLII